MGWISDFIYSSISDSLLPVVRPLLEDVVYEVLSDRQVPTRTDFREVRDLVNAMRGSVSSAANTAKKLDARVAALEAAQAEQAEHLEALFAKLEALQGARTPRKAPAKKKAPARKKPSSKTKTKAKKAS